MVALPEARQAPLDLSGDQRQDTRLQHAMLPVHGDGRGTKSFRPSIQISKPGPGNRRSKAAGPITHRSLPSHHPVNFEEPNLSGVRPAGVPGAGFLTWRNGPGIQPAGALVGARWTARLVIVWLAASRIMPRCVWSGRRPGSSPARVAATRFERDHIGR